MRLEKTKMIICEVDFYDQLREAIETRNGVLQDEVMDKILERFDSLDKTNETGRKKCVKAKKVSKEKAELGTRGKGRRRGR